jgi:hypothetical protein
MFAPEILATIQQIAEDFKDEIARIAIIARDKAITAGIWLRSKHGTGRFFLVTPDGAGRDLAGTGDVWVCTGIYREGRAERDYWLVPEHVLIFLVRLKAQKESGPY